MGKGNGKPLRRVESSSESSEPLMSGTPLDSAGGRDGAGCRYVKRKAAKESGKPLKDRNKTASRKAASGRPL